MGNEDPVGPTADTEKKVRTGIEAEIPAGRRRRKSNQELEEHLEQLWNVKSNLSTPELQGRK